MFSIRNYLLLFLTLLFFTECRAQSSDSVSASIKNSGYFSLGGRSTFSAFGDEGNGLGSGGQFRIQLSSRINTEWFADYITINVNNKVRSEYYHIGWSVMYYLLPDKKHPRLIQPYIVAGHCFDYNKMTEMANPLNTKNRLGSAVQAGIAMHFNLSSKFDISLTCQYMIHFTENLSAKTDSDPIEIKKENESALQGHLLTTISLNYKIFRLWKK